MDSVHTIIVTSWHTGADPENLNGRWLTGWLPIVNHTGAKGVAG